MEFTQNFSDDLDILIEALTQTENTFCFLRFGDGESAILRRRERPFITLREGENWSSENLSEQYRQALLESLQIDAPGCYVATICPACSGQSSAPLRSEVRAPLERQTYAELFGNANWHELQKAEWPQWLRERVYLVSSAPGADYQIPSNLPEYSLEFHEKIVDELLTVRKTIALAAGPSACILGHWLWKRSQAVTCLDVGSLFDQIYWGNTRHYMPEGSARGRRVCTWDGSGVGLDTD